MHVYTFTYAYLNPKLFMNSNFMVIIVNSIVRFDIAYVNSYLNSVIYL